MKLGVLFSGGKDSCYALYQAMQKHEIACLITMTSENKESYMFHTPTIEWVGLQAKAMSIPLLNKHTKGIKEEELQDLAAAIKEANQRFGIEGVVTGAVASVYQKNRIENICNELAAACISPLWHQDPEQLLQKILQNNFKFIISATGAAYMEKDWLGREINKTAIKELETLTKKYRIHPMFEGGEAETFVTDAPFFQKKVKILDTSPYWDEKTRSGWLKIKKAVLAGK